MAIQIKQIRSNLKGVISNILAGTQLAKVYDYYEPDVQESPVVIFDITDNQDTFLTNKENLIKIVFSAYIMVEIKIQGLKNAKDQLDTLTDQLIVELRKQTNLTLSGLADWISPAVGPRSQVETTSGNYMAQQLDITVNSSDFVN